jgi:DHA3 family multidrug efflux protein-like MFS transporter
VIQKVVPFARQGRVFGVAAAWRRPLLPITAFLIAPLAEFLIIPYMKGDAGRRRWGGCSGRVSAPSP